MVTLSVGVYHGPVTGLRRASLLLAVSVGAASVSACATTTSGPADGEAASSGRARDSAGPADGAEGASDAAPSGASSSGLAGTVSIQAQTLAAPVAVVSIAVAEATPCEQMCGRVGDCLDDREPLEASHLELGCLDLCVNVRADTPEAEAFHGCGQRDACGQLIECVGSNWAAAAGKRVEYDVLVDAAAVDTCELYCRGVYGCMYYNRTISQGIDFSADTEREIENCVTTCDPSDDAALGFAGCALEPTCEDYWNCYDREQRARYH